MSCSQIWRRGAPTCCHFRFSQTPSSNTATIAFELSNFNFNSVRYCRALSAPLLNSPTTMKKYLLALSLVGLVDAVSYMLVAPSIVFYVLELGGTYEQYGFILSSFSFASFCAKPFLGTWSDRFGFRIPYLCSLAMAAFGGLLYFLASCVKVPWLAIAMVLSGRLLGGVGAASSALAYAYLAKVVPNDEQTKTNSLLSMLRIIGMASGPGFNVFLAGIDVSLFGALHLDPLNSVGLVLFVSNVLAWCSIMFLLDEPDSSSMTSAYLQKKQSSGVDSSSSSDQEPTLWDVLQACWCAEILVPILSIFSFNASFQLIETAFAPAASHALQWGPVQTSTVFGGTSVLIFVMMLVVYQLSANKVPDESILMFGLCLGTFGYGLMYFLWTADSKSWHFILPIVLGVASFPFVGAPTRSVFTKHCDTKPMLDKYHGTMQAVLSMSASVAGFVTPGFVAAYVLRTPEEVESSARHRELSSLALLSPGLELLTLCGILYMKFKEEYYFGSTELEPEATDDELTPLAAVELSRDDGSRDERHPRRRASTGASYAKRRKRRRVVGWRQFDPNRRNSACLMGIAQPSLVGEYPDDNVGGGGGTAGGGDDEMVVTRSSMWI
jgi:ceroid-lipofuscinosis MFS transporter 7